MLAVAVVLTGCTNHSAGHRSSSPRSTPGETVRSSPSSPSSLPSSAPSSPKVVVRAQPCYVALPAAWAAAKQRGQLWRGVWDHQASKAPNAQGTGVLLESDSGTTARIAFVGKGHRPVEDVGTIRIDPNAPNASEPGMGYAGGIGWDAGTSDYTAFIYHPVNGEAAAWVWRLYLWDRHARKLTLVASNPVDSAGHPLRSGYVQPKLTSRYLYWIQAAPDTTGWGGSQLMQYALATGQTKVLYRGLTE